MKREHVRDESKGTENRIIDAIGVVICIGTPVAMIVKGVI